jgi:hypothetical protein
MKGCFTIVGAGRAWRILSPMGEPIGDYRGPLTFSSSRAALRFADAYELPVGLIKEVRA